MFSFDGKQLQISSNGRLEQRVPSKENLVYKYKVHVKRTTKIDEPDKMHVLVLQSSTILQIIRCHHKSSWQLSKIDGGFVTATVKIFIALRNCLAFIPGVPFPKQLRSRWRLVVQYLVNSYTPVPRPPTLPHPPRDAPVEVLAINREFLDKTLIGSFLDGWRGSDPFLFSRDFHNLWLYS